MDHKKVRKDAAFWTPWVWDEYTADTLHLSALENGIYMRLLALYYRDSRGPLPDDVKLLTRKVLARTEEERKAVELVLAEFFQKGEDGLWHHKRCDAELAKREAESERMSQGAKDNIENRPRDAKGRLMAANTPWPGTQGSPEQRPSFAGGKSSREEKSRAEHIKEDNPKEVAITVGDSSLGDSSSLYAPPNTNPNRVGASRPTSTSVASAEGSKTGAAPASEEARRTAYAEVLRRDGWGPSAEEREQAELRKKVEDGTAFVSSDLSQLLSQLKEGGLR